MRGWLISVGETSTHYITCIYSNGTYKSTTTIMIVDPRTAFMVVHWWYKKS